MGERRRLARCHTPDKDAYRFEGEARRAEGDASAHYGYPMERYQCPTCGWWHLTKVKPPRVYAQSRQGHAVEAEGPG